MSKSLRRFMLFGWVLIFAALFWGAYQGFFDPEFIRVWVSEAGWWGILLFLLLSIGSSLIFIPPTSLCFLSGLLYGPWIGMVLSILTVNLGAVILYWAGRFLSPRWTESLSRRLKRADLDVKIQKNGLIGVIVMRLIFVPFALVSLSGGVLKVRVSHFVIGTFVGTIPAIYLMTWAGNAWQKAMEEKSLLPLADLHGLIALLLFVAALSIPLVHRRIVSR